MPKLRNGGTDISMFSQWLARKCRNHNPLSELKLSQGKREALPRIYKAAEAAPEQIVMLDDGVDNTVIYFAAGRAFKIEVEEIAVEEAAKLPQKAVQW